jgi:hypothetical protein
MSLGKTDNFWWNKIGKNLVAHPDKQLILFLQRTGYQSTLNSNFLDAEQEIEDLFFENAGIAEADRDSLRNRIHVVVNADLFGGKRIIRR